MDALTHKNPCTVSITDKNPDTDTFNDTDTDTKQLLLMQILILKYKNAGGTADQDSFDMGLNKKRSTIFSEEWVWGPIPNFYTDKIITNQGTISAASV